MLFKQAFLSMYRVWSFVMLSLEKTTHKKAYVLVAMGLGLGMGMSFSVRGLAPQVNASPTIAEPEKIQLQIERLKSPELEVDATVRSGTVELLPLIKLGAPAVHLNTSATIGQGKAIIIQGTKADYSFSHLEKVQLGQEILILGSNGGWYRYTIVETKSATYDEFGTLSSYNQETLVLFVTHPLNQTLTAVIARPLR